MITIGRTTLLVADLGAASTFYQQGFGFNVLFDDEVAPGLRTIHVGPGSVREPGLWLLAATAPEASTRVGRQTGEEPTLVFYVPDLEASLDQLGGLGVAPHLGPDRHDDGTAVAHVRDNSGNEIVLVQFPPDPAM
jgi:catechol 2,3-dioxygenase-like lactoylglutathione lyase family enzyme